MPTIRVKQGEVKPEKYYWEKGYVDNYGYFLKWGGIHSWWTAILYLITGGTHVVLLMFTAYLKMDDIELMTESLHFAIFILVVGPNTVIGIIYRQNLDRLYTAMGKEFYDYEGTLTENCLKEKSLIIKRARKVKHFLSKSYVVIVMIACIALSFARPIFNFIRGDYEEKDKFDGILTHFVAVICWYPINTREPINFFICVLIQYIAILITPGVVFEMAITFLCFSEEICAQLDVIGVSMKNSHERAKMMMEKENVNYKKCLRICMKHSINHHQIMIDLFENFQAIYSYLLLILMIGSTFLLCLCSVNFISPNVSVHSKVYFGFFIIAETVNIFIYCYYGELIRQKGSYIGFALYDSDWMDDSITLKTYLSVVQGRSLKPLSLSAVGFMDASLSTFSNVLSSSYSYFNLLNLMSSQD